MENFEDPSMVLLQLEPEEQLVETETLLENATLHVQQAAVQMKLANQPIEKSIQDDNLPHSQCCYCFITDFSQNMELPFFGSSQPGDAYYFSPLKIKIFGIVDCSVPGVTLSAHVYDEGVGQKGRNNVAPLLIKRITKKLKNNDF